MSQPLTLAEIEVVCLAELDNAMKMALSLSDDDAVYDLNYISEKLAQVGVYHERLSDIQMTLTKISLRVIKNHFAASARCRVRDREVRALEEYADLPTNEKGMFIEVKTKVARDEAEGWANLNRIVREIKDAVSERVAVMRRLDSDLRLHAKIFEQRSHAGATSAASYKGNSTKEMDI
jgi:hypothetical protein